MTAEANGKCRFPHAGADRTETYVWMGVRRGMPTKAGFDVKAAVPYDGGRTAVQRNAEAQVVVGNNGVVDNNREERHA